MQTISLSLDAFREAFSPSDRLVIYGCGEVGETVLCFFEYIQLENIVKRIVDKRLAGKCGKINSLKIDDPVSIKGIKGHKVLVCSIDFREQIVDYLTNELGVSNTDIITIELVDPATTRSEASPEWNKGIRDEIYFWTKSLATRHHIKRYCTERAVASKPFNQELLGLLDYPASQPVKVLDVGSGPVTVLGYHSDRNPVTLTCIDPLAYEYQKLYKDFNFSPPVVPECCCGEELLSRFSPREFDIVYSCNALDHSFDPKTILENMYQLVKPGGLLFVSVYENEAEEAGYQGLHQWNFRLSGNDVELWSRDVFYNIRHSISGLDTLKAYQDEKLKRQIHFYCKKLSNSNI